MIPILIISKEIKLVKNYVNNFSVGKLFFNIAPSTKEFSIDDIKNLINETKIFNPKTRIYYLENFNLSSIPAQNSFLKLLEEPPYKVQFILSADNINNLLPTIISRVKIVKLQKKSIQNVFDKRTHLEIERLLNQTDDVTSLMSFSVKNSESAKNILLQLTIFFQKRLSLDNKAHLILKKILLLNNLLNNNNLNPQLTIDQVLIFIQKTYTMK